MHWEGGSDDACWAKYTTRDKELVFEVGGPFLYMDHQDCSYPRDCSKPSFFVKEEELVAGNFGWVAGVVPEENPMTRHLLLCLWLEQRDRN